MTNISTTNIPSGITNAALDTVMQSYGAPDPTVFHTYFNDFDVYTASDWTNTATGVVTNSILASGAVDGGILSMVNSAANNDLNSLQLKAATFGLIAGNKWWIKARFSVDSATNAALILGLIQTTTTPLTVTNGVYFSKAAASTSLVANVTKASVTSSLNIGTLSNLAYVNVGLHYNGDSTITVYLNNAKVGALATTNMPTTNLNLTLAVANGTAALNTLLVDYVLVSTERSSTLL